MKPRILIVDDESQIRHLLRTCMEQRGYETHEAADGRQAIAKLAADAFDLVIADIVMPEQDGLEVIMYLRKQQPNVKIIAISAVGNELFLQSARGLGASYVFTKPFELADIEHAVEELLRKQPVVS